MGSCFSKKKKESVVEDAHVPPFELKVRDEPIPIVGNACSPSLPPNQESLNRWQTTKGAPKSSVEPQHAKPNSSQPASNHDDRATIRQELLKELQLDDMPVIDVDKALDQTSGEFDFLIELMDSYLGQYGKQLAEIKRGLECQDWNCLALESHSLKGAAANLFIMRMRVVSFFLEKSGKNLREQSQNGEEIGEATKTRVSVGIELLEATFAEFEQQLETLRASVQE